MEFQCVFVCWESSLDWVRVSVRVGLFWAVSGE